MFFVRFCAALASFGSLNNPLTDQRHSGIFRGSPDAGQPRSLVDQLQILVHGSSLGRLARTGAWRVRTAEGNSADGPIVGEGRIGSCRFPIQALNSRVGCWEERGRKSSLARLEAVARALIAAQGRTPGTRGFQCGFDAHGLGCFSSEGKTASLFIPYPHRVLSSGKPRCRLTPRSSSIDRNVKDTL